MLLSTTAITILIANLFDRDAAPRRRAHRWSERRPDQGIHGADTPHTRASGAWRSFDGHTYVLIY
jgi:hypothetical protein